LTILNPDSPTRFKRQKTVSENPEITNLIDDNIDDNDVIITCIKTLPLKPCVMFCGFSSEDKEILKMVLFCLSFFFYILY